MRKADTFGAAFNLYAAYAKQHLRSWEEILGLRNRYLKHLENRKLRTITRLELQTLHTEIGAKAGKTAANRTIELISCVFNRAADWDMHQGTNPASRIKKFRLQSRARFLMPEEVGPLFSAIQSCKSRTIRDFLFMCIYTAARSGNVMSMRWQDVDLKNAIWHVPDSKNGDPYDVPLLPGAVEILEARSSIRSRSAYVFPAAQGSGHMTNPRKTWYDILSRAKIADLRIHDLRRSHASWQLRTGASLPIIGKTLNHRDPRSTLIYARMDTQQVRDAMGKAIDAMRLHA